MIVVNAIMKTNDNNFETIKNAVKEPIRMMKLSAVIDSSNNGDMRATIKIPAVTIVAACIKAEIGVGPSIESGSHT